MAVISEVGILRFFAETCLNARRQTSLRAGGDEIGKGQDSTLGLPRNIGPLVKFRCVGLTDLGHEMLVAICPG